MATGQSLLERGVGHSGLAGGHGPPPPWLWAERVVATVVGQIMLRVRTAEEREDSRHPHQVHSSPAFQLRLRL